LEFQRTARFSTFDSLLQQEREYLKIVESKIVALRPHVFVVERTVSRLALEFLLENNLTLILNVKPHLIRSIARVTRTCILPSTGDIPVGRSVSVAGPTYNSGEAPSVVGYCGRFYLKSYKESWGRKTLLFFEGNYLFFFFYIY